MAKIDAFFKLMNEQGASDLHLAAGLLAVGRLGELPFFARTPAGFPEEAEHWIDPGALLERMSFSFALARRFLPGIRPGSAFPPTWRGGGRGRDALGLALASPDFQWA